MHEAILLLAGRILPFDQRGAEVFPIVLSGRTKLGLPVSEFDTLIASVARSHGAVLATRDISGFEYCGIRIVNPWAA